MFHPATVVFPPALAVAQALGRSGADAAQMQRVIERIRTLRTTARVGIFLD